MKKRHPDLTREELLHLTAHGVGEETMIRWRLGSLAQRHEPPADAAVPVRWLLASRMHPSLPSPHDLLRGARGARQAPRPSVEGLLADAFSHCGCYMCKDGVTACDYCEGSDPRKLPGVCPDCEGTGLVPCRFCGGTGWLDAVIIPAEVRPEFLRCCRAAALQEAEDLNKTFGVFARRGLEEVSPRSRRNLLRRTLRTRCRLKSLESPEASAAGDMDDNSPPPAVVARVEHCWRLLVFHCMIAS
jgi:hypothetical protein